MFCVLFTIFIFMHTFDTPFVTPRYNKILPPCLCIRPLTDSNFVSSQSYSFAPLTSIKSRFSIHRICYPVKIINIQQSFKPFDGTAIILSKTPSVRVKRKRHKPFLLLFCRPAEFNYIRPCNYIWENIISIMTQKEENSQKGHDRLNC